MDLFNLILTRLFDVLLYPFGALQPIWGLTFISILTGVVMVWLFGKFSNQARIRRLKDLIRGHMLEMWIFRDIPRVVLKAQGRALWNVVKYASCSLRALGVLIIPVIFIMIQLQARYGYRPLQPDESALVRIVYAEAVTAESMDVSLEPSDAFVVETPALRIPDAREVDFRIRAEQAGDHEIVAKAGKEQISKRFCVGGPHRAMSPVRSRCWTTRFFHPVEPAMPSGPIQSIDIEYPGERVSVCGFRLHWLWSFFVISIIAGFILKKPFGIEL